MKIQHFDKSNEQYINEAANLLASCFPHAYSDCAVEEMIDILDKERLAVMAIEDNHLIGFAGAIPQYGVTGWELHPLAVNEIFRNMGIGSQLVYKLEEEVAAHGGIVMYHMNSIRRSDIKLLALFPMQTDLASLISGWQKD